MQVLGSAATTASPIQIADELQEDTTESSTLSSAAEVVKAAVSLLLQLHSRAEAPKTKVLAPPEPRRAPDCQESWIPGTRGARTCLLFERVLTAHVALLCLFSSPRDTMAETHSWPDVGSESSGKLVGSTTFLAGPAGRLVAALA